MRSILFIFLSVLIGITSLAHAQNGETQYQIDRRTTAQAPWKVGDIVAEDKQQNIYRKFIGVTSKGYYVVQDFIN